MVEINHGKSNFKDWDSVFSKPSEVTIETLKAGSIVSRVSGLINLKNPDAKELKDGKSIVPVLTHLIRHPKFGHFLVDTGLCSSFAKSSGGSFKGLIKSFYFKNRYLLDKGHGIDEQLMETNVRIKALFLTHAHEHVSGVASLPDDILRICGEGEKDVNYFPLVYSDYFKKHGFKRIDFSKSQDMPIFGKTEDIFKDGSFWAISTPGHTKGHISYLINGVKEQVLLTGDACITEKGYMMGVEPGGFSEDIGKSRESLLRIKKFVDKYPQVKIIFGHESEKYKIKYI